MWWILTKKYLEFYTSVPFNPPNSARRLILSHQKLTQGYRHAGSVVKKPTAYEGDGGLIPRSGRSLGGGQKNPTPVFLPGESHGQQEPGGLQPTGSHRIRLTEQLNNNNQSLFTTKTNVQCSFKDSLDTISSILKRHYRKGGARGHYRKCGYTDDWP